MRSVVILLLALFAMTLMHARSAVLEGNGWSVRVRGEQGVELRVQGATLGYRSTTQVATPDWSVGFYSSVSTPPKAEAKADQITLTHMLGERGQAIETLQKVDPSTLEWSLQIRWGSGSPAIVEWCIGQWKTDLLQGAQLSGQGTLATDRLQNRAITLENDLLFRGTRLTIDTSLARIAIEADSNTPFTVLDGRNNPNRVWSREVPSLWLGTLNAPLSKSKIITLRYRMHFEPKPLPSAGRTLEVRARVEGVPDRWRPTPEAPLLIPPPKILWLGEGEPLRLPASQTVSIRIESPEYQPCADALRKELARYGLKSEISVASEPASKSIFIGGSAQLQRRYPVPALAGAYHLQVASESVAIIGNGAEGAFYGVQTLLQWLQPTEDALQATPAQITDYPHLRFRGVHLFPSTQPDFLPRLIENVIAPLKFNHLVIECGYTQWDAIRPAWVDVSAPKPLLKQAVDTARAHLLEPIPLIQSLGHMSWVFRNGAFQELAEDPDLPWAIAPRRPSARALLEKIYDEVFDLFRPRMFHIGMDEVTMRGRFPHSPESADASVADLFIEQTRWAYDALTRRGTQKVMLWADMLLARGEANDPATNAPDPESAREMRQELNPLPNLILCDWHYTPAEPSGYKSVPLLQNTGFKEIIATTWYTPENVYTFARSARQRRIAGLLQSTWAGYSLNEQTLRSGEYRQFVAYVYAGLYAWDTDSPAPRDLPYDVEQIFARLYRRDAVLLRPQPGFVVDLAEVGNYAIAEWLGELSPQLVGTRFLQGHQFRVAPRVLMLGGYLVPDPNLPQSVRLLIDRSVRALYFLHTCAFPAEPSEEVARYRFEYEDGSVVEQPVLYGIHLRAWNETGFTFEGVPLWSQLLGDGRWARVRLMRWQNPHPEKRLRAVSIEAKDPVASLILVALSGE